MDLPQGAAVRSADDTALRAHRRQFLLAPRPVEVACGWRREILGPGHVLHRCPLLPVTRARDSDGTSWLLFGRAVESDPERPDPATSIEHADTAEIPDLSHSWAGRWLLANASRVYLDASGLLGCFYHRDPDGRLWLSSSPALIAQHAFAAPPEILDPRRLVYERGISWFPPPLSRFAGLRRLLPSQALDLATGRPEPRPLMPRIDACADYDGLVAWLTRALRTVMVRLADTLDEPPWLGLTAGYDSRLMLTIAVSSGIEVRPYTRLTGRMSVADRVLPGLIARQAGVRHWTMPEVTSPRAMKARRALLEQHSAGHTSDGDARPFLSGARDGMRGVTFGGHGFAVAGGFNDWRTFPAQMPVPAEAASLLMRAMGEPPDSSATRGLTEWFAWARQQAVPNLDWRDRLFLEQRQAGWLASKEQVFDLTPLERFPILNAATIYARVLGLPSAQRKGSCLQQSAIASLRPDLAVIPFNPGNRTFLGRYPHLVLRRVARRLLHKTVRQVARRAEA